ncbi:MAG: 50S ribosomal protein L15 [Nitrospirae bacterium]|nr:50S ribosomal protein L15 [Nitrospirota bacterium]
MLTDLGGRPGSKKRRKRVGRGLGSGHGRTACRGYKGLGARTGGKVHASFEGGQTPLHRRLPKRGFTNIFRREWAIVNVGDLAPLADEKREITPELLLERRLIKELKHGVKVLGGGSLEKPVVVKAHAFARSAREIIEKAGGRAEVLPA